MASYSGDADNEVAADACDEATERVDVSRPATPPPVIPDPPAAPEMPAPPTVSGLRLSPHRFEPVGNGGREAGGTTIRFDLSADAEVSFRIMPAPPAGEAVGPLSHAHGFSRRLQAGFQVQRFTGTIGRQELRRGRYLLFVWAVNEDGRGERESTPFRVVRP